MWGRVEVWGWYTIVLYCYMPKYVLSEIKKNVLQKKLPKQKKKKETKEKKREEKKSAKEKKNFGQVWKKKSKA